MLYVGQRKTARRDIDHFDVWPEYDDDSLLGYTAEAACLLLLSTYLLIPNVQVCRTR